jgi:hypothetical protein
MNDLELAKIERRIYSIRGVRVILDADLAVLYGVSTKRLNEQFRRNRKRFPDDFAFQLTPEETAALRSQFVTSTKDKLNWSQFATSSSRHRGKAYRPWALTEHGALQAANILNSANAVRMSVFVIRAFVKMREQLATNPCDPSAIDRVRADIDCYHDISFKVKDYSQVRFDFSRVNRAAVAG